jgi:hypothetical protein
VAQKRFEASQRAKAERILHDSKRRRGSKPAGPTAGDCLVDKGRRVGEGGLKVRKTPRMPDFVAPYVDGSTVGVLVAAAVDRKLWEGAADGGWVVQEDYSGSYKQGHWIYRSPGGEPFFTSRKEAILHHTNAAAELILYNHM